VAPRIKRKIRVWGEAWWTISNTQTNSQKYTGKSRFSRISFVTQTSMMLSFAKADRYRKPRKPSTGNGHIRRIRNSKRTPRGCQSLPDDKGRATPLSVHYGLAGRLDFPVGLRVSWGYYNNYWIVTPKSELAFTIGPPRSEQLVSVVNASVFIDCRSVPCIVRFGAVCRQHPATHFSRNRLAKLASCIWHASPSSSRRKAR